MQDTKRGYLLVGLNPEETEVVVNLDHDRTGHITFSPQQAIALAALLVKKAREIEPCDVDGELGQYDKFGRVLAKAMVDQFDYQVRLRTGDLIRFRSAVDLGNDWIHLEEACRDDGSLNGGDDYHRGVDVRLSDIVYAVDAPYGS